MSLVEIEVKLPPMDFGAKISQGMNSILTAAGSNIAKCISRHLRRLNASRHKGGHPPSNHFSPDHVLEPVVSNDTVTVGVAIPGISRAYHDIDIYPKEASALAIPLHATAYGISPREINDRGTYKLFRIKKDGVPGNVLYRSEDNQIIPMYALTAHVHQNQDPKLMPSDAELKQAGIDGALQAIKAILGA